jgi:bifunctional non-homologous end joining protein LigD
VWQYQLKLDGYRAIAFKTAGKLYLRSRNNKDFAERYPAVIAALAKLPDETVIDGEVVAFDDEGKPSFNALQNYGSAPAPVVFYVFDVMVLAGKDLMSVALEKRQKLLETKVLPKLKEPCRYTGSLGATLAELVASVRLRGLRDWWQSGGTVAMSQTCGQVRGRRCASIAGRSS